MNESFLTFRPEIRCKVASSVTFLIKFQNARRVPNYMLISFVSKMLNRKQNCTSTSALVVSKTIKDDVLMSLNSKHRNDIKSDEDPDFDDINSKDVR